MNRYIDTHSHLFVEQFDDDRAEVIERAQEEGVNKILLPNIDEETIGRLKECSEQFSDTCLPMMGLHPCSVKEEFKSQLNVIENELKQGNYVAVGEIGLDYYWDKSLAKEQKLAYQRQLEIAQEMHLPVAVHTRDSFEDCFDIAERVQKGGLSGVFHCFGGTAEDAKKLADINFMVGIGGTSTFKKSSLPQELPNIPLNQILLETDSPYLAPTPHRGKRNESSYLLHVAEKLASIYEKPLDLIASITSENAERLFKL